MAGGRHSLLLAKVKMLLEFIERLGAGEGGGLTHCRGGHSLVGQLILLNFGLCLQRDGNGMGGGGRRGPLMHALMVIRPLDLA